MLTEWGHPMPTFTGELFGAGSVLVLESQTFIFKTGRHFCMIWLQNLMREDVVFVT